VNPIVSGPDELKDPFTDLRTYDSHRKKVCNILHIDEVFAPRAYAEATVKSGNKQTRVCYSSVGQVYDCQTLHFPVENRVRIKPNRIEACQDSNRRRKRLIYLSHVIAQCGLREKALRPLWRLLRVGYTIRYTNFSRLVHKIAKLCNRRSDFTRDLTAPAKGLRFIPRFIREAQPLVVKGISLPRWRLQPVYTGSIRDLNLD
jgi:hypothetical protein